MSTKSELRRRWRIEPGKSMRQKILARVVPHTHEALPDSSLLYELLDGLPFREEVPNGRDFRGNDCVGGFELDFSYTDFSFSESAGDLRCCNLTGSRFDESCGESSNFHKSVIRDCSFRHVR